MDHVPKRNRESPRARFVTAMVVLTIIARVPAHADDAPVVPVQGGGIVPYHEEFIRLVSEEIDISLERMGYRVEVAYVFTNTGEATTVTMGFPNESDWMYGIGIADFQAWVDGNEQEIYRAVSRESEKTWGPDSAPDYYFECFDTTFAAGQTRQIKNVYSQDYMVDHDRTEMTAKYVLTTGAYWRGFIDSVIVRIHYLQRDADRAPRTLILDPTEVEHPVYVAGPSVSPRPTRTTANGVEIVMTNVEPDKDIEISLPMPVVDYITADSELASARYSYAPENVLDNDVSTSWVEGKPGPGIGSTLALELSSSAGGGMILGEYEITAVGMVNGYAANGDLYRQNNRVKTARLSWSSPLQSASNGSVTWKLDDEMVLQMYRFPAPVGISELSIEIEDVYPGSRYDDTCIAEIVVVPAVPRR